MRSTLKLATVKGITVYLHFTLLFFIAWLVVVYIASGMQWLQLAWSLVFLLAVFTCIVLHEYGHALVAARFGIDAKKVTLYPIGGIASIEKLPENPKQELLISAAGPAVSFTIAAFLLLYVPQKFSWQSLLQFSGNLNQENFLYMLGMINMFLALFNLIPAFPMDGGRILRALLAFKYNYIKATVIANSVGRVVAVLFILIGLITLNLVLALIGIFILVFARAEEAYLQLKALVKGIRLREVLMYDYNSIDASLTVNEAANILQNNHSKHFIVLRDGVPVGVLNRIEVIKAVAEKEYNKKVAELMQTTIEQLDGNMLVADILDKISGHEEKIYPVFNKHQFSGVVSFRHIIEYLLLHKVATSDYSKAKGLVELV